MGSGLKTIPLAGDRDDGYDGSPENGDKERRTGIAKIQAGLLLDQQLCAIFAGFEAGGLGDVRLVATVVGDGMHMPRRFAVGMRSLDRFGCTDVGMVAMRFQHACIGNS